MSRRLFRNTLLVFVAIGVLFRLGAQFRQIVMGLQKAETDPTSLTAPLDSLRAPQPRAASLQWTGMIAGHVAHAGIPAADAWVLLEGPSSQELQTDASGRFAFANLKPGEYYLFATQMPWASERLGPLPLDAGEELRGLTLDLQEGFSVEGVIVGLPERIPIAGALIRAAGQQTNSDDTGHFSLVGLPRGRLAVFVEADGHLTRHLDLTPPAQHLTITLEKGAKVFGSVLFQDTPAANVEIAAVRYGSGISGEPPIPVAKTDRQGRFEGFAPLGQMDLIAHGGGWAEARSGTLDLQPGEERRVDFTIGQGGTLTGTVRDATLEPQAGCRIEALDVLQNRALSFAISGRHGEFWLTALPPSTYSVLAQCPEGRAELSGILINDDEEEKIELVLGNATLAGRIIDPHGFPIADARIDAYPQGSGTRQTAFFWKSDGLGRFSLTGLVGERFVVTARAAEGEAELRDIAAGKQDLILVLTASGIEGTTCGAQGGRLVDFTIAAIPIATRQAAQSPRTPGQPRSQRFVSADGTFKMPLLPGRYELKIGAPGQRSMSIEGLEIQPNRMERLDLRLNDGVEVAGEILSEEDGAPIAGAIVTNDPSLLTAFARSAPVTTGGSWARTDAKGNFHLDGITPDDAVPLFVSKKGFQTKLQKIAAPGPRARILLLPESSTETEKEGDKQPDEIVGVGLSLFPREARLLVGNVIPFSPAQAAGIQVGDELLGIDGHAITGWAFTDVVGAIRGIAGTTVTLSLRREGTDFEVAVSRVAIRF